MFSHGGAGNGQHLLSLPVKREHRRALNKRFQQHFNKPDFPALPAEAPPSPVNCLLPVRQLRIYILGMGAS